MTTHLPLMRASDMCGNWLGSPASVLPSEAKLYLDSIAPGPSGRKAGAWDSPRQPLEQLGGSHPVPEWRGLFKANLIDGGPHSAKGKHPTHRATFKRSTHHPGFCGVAELPLPERHSREPRRGREEREVEAAGWEGREMKR